MAALDFDLACSYRVLLHEMEMQKGMAKLIAYEVSKIFGDGSGSEPATFDTSGAEVW